MLKNTTNDIFEKYKKLRRKIHQNPELGFEEYMTGDIIKKCLTENNISFEDNIASTGIVGLINGRKPGKTLILRADMDALPINEENNCDYKSQHIGKMHACGHDVHVATLLMASEILSKHKEEFDGSIKLVFQPAEETTGGAKPMIDSGILLNPTVDFAAGFHVKPELEVGKVITIDGPVMASPDNFYIKIWGKGGHCATPYLNNDIILAGTQIINALNNITSKFVNPIKPSLITVCSFNSGYAPNVMPNEGTISGSFRTFDQKTRELIANKIKEISIEISKIYSITAEVEIEYLYPPLVNDSKLTQIMQKSAEKIIGKDNLINDFEPTMLGEDFSYFGQNVPSTYFYLGSKIEGVNTTLHSPTFDVDENCILIGSQILAQFAIDLLKK